MTRLPTEVALPSNGFMLARLGLSCAVPRGDAAIDFASSFGADFAEQRFRKTGRTQAIVGAERDAANHVRLLGFVEVETDGRWQMADGRWGLTGRA
jgi:hypothetical protein